LHQFIDKLLVNCTFIDGAGHQKYGVCTNYFDRLPEGDIPCFLRSTPGFRLPDNKQAPIIMIGAGSGIAPFRSFWQEREAQIKNGETCGKMFLFFGCRNPKFDNIYGPELSSLLRKGVLHQIFLAFSRGDKKVNLF
jgi:nitric-oxide synthase